MMKLRVIFFLALGSAAAFAQSGYVWDIRQNPVAQNSNLWSVNAPYGSYSFTGSGVNFSGSGMLISIQPVPAEDASTDQVMPNTSSSDYDVTSTLALKAGGGTYIHVLRASWTGVSSCFNGYSYTSVELVIPSSFTSPGAATLNINECVAGSMQAKGSTTITATDGMSLRTVIFGGTLYVYTANSIQAWEGTEGTDLSRSQSVLVYQGAVDAMTGYPGIGGHGMPSGSGITSAYIGHHDDVAPPASSIASSIFPTSVSLRWHGTADDPIGTGVFSYNITRNGTLIASPITPEWVDNTVQASTAYSYTISAVDYHGNASAATTINVTTPPANAIDPRRTGIYPTGSYWGGGGEQIDTLTGNLNFSCLLSSQCQNQLVGTHRAELQLPELAAG